MEVIRLETLHPILVHFTIGAIPLLLLAAILAWRKASEAWTFVADVTLAVTAASAVLSALSGLYLQFFFPWPGGLDFWRYLHLGFGAASTLVLLVFAGIRLRRRARQTYLGSGSVFTAAGSAILLFATGWIGGEVLVFRSGMAVQAAGNGALALPAPDLPLTGPQGPPENLEQVMHRLRGRWSQVTSSTAHALVEKPTADYYAQVESAATDMADMAEWLKENPSGHSGLGFMAGQFKDSAEALKQAAQNKD